MTIPGILNALNDPEDDNYRIAAHYGRLGITTDYILMLDGKEIGSLEGEYDPDFEPHTFKPYPSTAWYVIRHIQQRTSLEIR